MVDASRRAFEQGRPLKQGAARSEGSCSMIWRAKVALLLSSARRNALLDQRGGEQYRLVLPRRTGDRTPGRPGGVSHGSETSAVRPSVFCSSIRAMKL